MQKEISMRVEERAKEIQIDHDRKMGELQQHVDGVTFENDILMKKIERYEEENTALKQRITANENISKRALLQSNFNEQYSRKTNIKITGVKEERSENTQELVQRVVREKAAVEIDDDEIIAVHRIPGKKNLPRPIIIKLKNTESKAKVMRKRKVVKESNGGIKFVDDVTFLNTELIARLLKHDKISSAWYFNSHVYGLYDNKRIRFDIFDNIDEKILEIISEKNTPKQ